MTATDIDAVNGDPIDFERACGGWLATTPERAPLRIGVTAATEDAARALLRETIDKWLRTLEGVAA
jgi:hypothetical protein